MIQFKKVLALSLFVFVLFPLQKSLGKEPSQKMMEKTVQQQEISYPDNPIKSTEKTKKSEYVLPFPGLLPDHPLYFLKSFRDALMDRLIVDPVRKSEFYLLQADKKLAMVLVFAEKGEVQKAENTLLKSTKHMELSILGLTTLKAQDKDVPGYVVDRIAQALVKHEEVLTELIDPMQENRKAVFSQALAVIKKLQGEVGKLK